MLYWTGTISKLDNKIVLAQNVKTATLGLAVDAPLLLEGWAWRKTKAGESCLCCLEAKLLGKCRHESLHIPVHSSGIRIWPEQRAGGKILLF